MIGQEYILLALGVWVLVLTLGVGFVLSYFIRLSKGVEKGNLIKVLEKVLVRQDGFSKSLNEIKKRILDFEKKGQLHIQKVGIVRFNPFKEMGGDHSFSLALLDGKDNGFVITGLHTRERTRVYLKRIKRGQSTLELSSEEKKALKEALKSKS